MNSLERFLGAVHGKKLDRPPVWIMRQAGRTLPEYLALRKKHAFWEICKTPELAATVTLQPLQRFPLDAAVIFSDILTIPAAMGLDVTFKPALAITPPVNTIHDIRGLKTVDVSKDLGYVRDAIQTVYGKIGENKAVLGFAGAPFTLACYMVDGGSSRQYPATKTLMYSDPAAFQELLTKLTDVTGDYLQMQAEAHATAVQLFDTWACELTVPDFRRFVLPGLQRLVQRLHEKGVPVIYYVNGMGNLLEAAADSGADVLGVDWRISLQQIRERMGAGQTVQGNLDPTILLSNPAEIRTRTRQMLDETGGQRHIVNLGHGILPQTPVDHIDAFVQAVVNWRRSHA